MNFEVLEHSKKEFKAFLTKNLFGHQNPLGAMQHFMLIMQLKGNEEFPDWLLTTNV